MVSCRAAVLEETGRIEIREFEIPQLGRDDTLLRIELAGVCGSDYKYFSGSIDVPLPIILGHEILGRIASIGEEAAARYGLKEGDRVTVEGPAPCWSCEFCWRGQYVFCTKRRRHDDAHRNQDLSNKRSGYGKTGTTVPPELWGAMAEYMYVAPASIMHKLPGDIPAEDAFVTRLVANGIQWLRSRGDVSVGDTVLIQGTGPQGLAAAAVAREAGAGMLIVSGLSSDVARLALAREMGADYTVMADQEDVFARVEEVTKGHMADVVLDATGSPAAFQASLKCVRPLGTLVLAGLTGTNVVTPLLADQIIWKEVRVQGVHGKGAQAYGAAYRFMEHSSNRYPLAKIMSNIYPLNETQRAIQAAGGSGGDTSFIKGAIAPWRSQN